MNKLTLFLAKHSQKLALASVGLALSASYYIQPNYEVFVRYAILATDSGAKEIKPSERIQRLFDEVCAKFTWDTNQRTRVDLFMQAAWPHPVALGSILHIMNNRGYAFIGLPQFVNYAHASDVPLESGYFYNKKFPHGPYSLLGKELLDLMILPDDVVRFLLARELVRLGVKTKYGTSAMVSSRSKSILTTTGMIGGLYGSYQISYILNRTFSLPLRWTSPHRLLLYTSLAFLGLLCQWPLALAFRRHVCFNVDQVTVSADPALFTKAGCQYYEWRIRWNRFWYDRAQENHDRRNVSTKSTGQYDPIQAYQDEQERVKLEQQQQSEHLSIGEVDPGYYMPHIDDRNRSIQTPTLKRKITKSQFHYNIDPRNRSCGNEQWAADGDGIGFGLTELLSSGLLLPILARFFALFTAPATSSRRSAEIDNLAGQDGHM